MNFKTETSRSETIKAIDKAAQLFKEKLNKESDVLYLDSSREKVIAFTGMDIYAPVCMHLENDSQLYENFSQYDGSILIDASDMDTMYVNDQKVVLEKDLSDRIKAIYKRVINSPGMINDKGELEIDLKSYHVGSHYGVNLLLGDRKEYDDCLQSTPKSVLDEFGRGSFRGKQEKQVLATRYVLAPEENGEPANRQFYLTENGKQIFYSLDVNHNVKSAKCVHSQNHSIITYETECGLEIKRTIFLLPQEKDMPSANEVQLIEIRNLKDKPRNLRIIVTGMFGITDPATLAGDIVYANVVVESELYYKDGKPIAVSAHHQPAKCNGEKRYAMLLQDGETMEEYCSSYYDFIGSSSLDAPEMIARLSNAHSRRQAAFFAMAKSFVLNDKTDIVTFVGMADNDGDIRPEFDIELNNLYNKYKDTAELKKTYEKMLKDNGNYYSYLTVYNDDVLSDTYLSKNLPFQVLYQTYVSRSFAWTQKSYRETGFREIQDIFASMYYMHACGEDELVKKLINSWAENVFRFGYAYHNFTSRGKEPGMCSDDQLWLIQAVYRYIKLTGDYDYLKEELKIAGEDARRPLAETLKSIIIYSGKISVGKHSLPLLDTADWNDCLRLDKEIPEGPQKEKIYYKQLEERKQEFGVALDNELSESVMNACLLKIAADELYELAKDAGMNDLAELCKEVSDKTYESVRENAWIKDYYARCLINDKRGYDYLGSAGDNLSLDPSIDGTYYLNGFSWPLLADIADEKQIDTMLDVIDKYLKCDAGLKLVTPVNYDLLGIVTGSSFYLPGDRENGGVFKHAAMMCTVACLKKAKTVKDQKLAKRLRDLAFFMIDKTLPYKTLENPYVLKGNPRFCTQYNNSETGEGIGPILSGTASWLTLAFYEILGVDINNNTLKINPIINSDKMNYTLKINNTKIDISIKAVNDYKINDASYFVYDGNRCDQTITLPSDHKTHTLEVVL